MINKEPVWGITRTLPKDGKWTQKKRDAWLNAIAAAVDLVVEVKGE